MKNITTRYLNRSDREGLRAFMKREYGQEYILAQEKFFEWYTHPARQKNAPDALPVIGAFLGDDLVGHIFVIPHYFSDRAGAKLPMVWNSNFMVQAEFRQKGIGPAIVRRIFDDQSIAVSAGTGASLQEKGGRSLLSVMGYEFGFMRKYVFLLDEGARGFLKDPMTEDAERVRESLRRFARASRPEASRAAGRAFDLERFDDPRLTDFWEEWGAREFYGTWRDADFFQWRYGAHPVFRYRAVAIADEKNKIRALAVWRRAALAPSGKYFGRITEFLAQDGFGEDLASVLLANMKEAGVSLADFSTTTDHFDSALIGAGFIADSDFTARAPRLLEPLIHVDPFVNIVAKAVRDQELFPDFNSFDQWYATAADGDQDRPNH
ncbi:MAG: hypothetical protein AAB915_01520 [Patescibacteria group bacterium]